MVVSGLGRRGGLGSPARPARAAPTPPPVAVAAAGGTVAGARSGLGRHARRRRLLTGRARGGLAAAGTGAVAVAVLGPRGPVALFARLALHGGSGNDPALGAGRDALVVEEV